MKPIYWLKELSKKDLAIAGGKGANLAEMANIGLPVPPAFILSSGAYFDFIARSGIDALIRKETEDLDIQDSRKLQEVSDRIKAAIIGSPVPQDTRVEIIRAYNKLCGVELMPSLSQEAHVAVRSSATAEDLPEASFAGQQATFLNVRGSEELVKAVRKCWASLFEARAIYYRGINNFDHLKVGLAAVVQKMVQSEKSGVMFTVDPVTNDAGRLVIEGGFGLGEAIVSGLIIPDRYVVDKKTRKILLKQPAKQEVMIVKKGEGDECVPVPEELQEVQKLSEDEILSLADYGIAIEEHYQFPQDIEWAIEGDRIYIVQSRAITTLPVEMREEIKEEAKKATTVVSEKPQAVEEIDFGVATEKSVQSEEKKQTDIPVKEMDFGAAVPEKPVQEEKKMQAAVPIKEMDFGVVVAEKPIQPEEKPLPTEKRESQSVAQAPEMDLSAATKLFDQPVEGELKAQQASPISVEQAKRLLQGIPASPGIASGAVKLLLNPKEMYKIKKGDVLVTKMTNPDYVPAMKRAAAIVTDEGGITAHAAIVSRELGIPCIVGTREATSVLKEGQRITVDAKRGIVYEGTVQFETPEKTHAEQVAAKVVESTPIVTGTKIYVNLAEPDRAEEVAAKNVDGVGLFRAEFLMAQLGVHPKKLIKEGQEEKFIESIARGLRKVCAAFFPRPVVYRANDFKTNEYKDLEGGAEFEPHEENPMIGYRGCFRYLKDSSIFKLEVKAIRRVREQFGMKNLWLMIPFVREVDELKQVKTIMESEGLHRSKDFKLWIMVEVPSTIFIIDKFIDVGIDGISIGSNDLTQLILGIDRDNPIVAEEFDEREESIQVALKHVIGRCNVRGITSSLCGQAPSVFPEFAERLVEYGINSMSVNPDVIDVTRRNVAAAEQKLMLKWICSKEEEKEKPYSMQ